MTFVMRQEQPNLAGVHSLQSGWHQCKRTGDRSQRILKPKGMSRDTVQNSVPGSASYCLAKPFFMDKILYELEREMHDV